MFHGGVGGYLFHFARLVEAIATRSQARVVMGYHEWEL